MTAGSVSDCTPTIPPIVCESERSAAGIHQCLPA